MGVSHARQPGRQAGENGQDRQHHHHGEHEGEGAGEDVADGDARVVERRLHRVDRHAERRREQAHLHRHHGQHAEPDQVHLEGRGNGQHDGQHDQHDRDRVDDAAQRDHDRQVGDQEAPGAQAHLGDGGGDTGGHAGERQHAAVKRGRDDEEQHRHRHVTGLGEHVPKLAPAQAAAHQGDHEGAGGPHGTGLGGREEAAVQAAQHQHHQRQDGKELHGGAGPGLGVGLFRRLRRAAGVDLVRPEVGHCQDQGGKRSCHQQAGQDDGEEHAADRLLGQHAVDAHQQRGRDQHAQHRRTRHHTDSEARCV
eukprot:Opistho-1_new@107273